MICKHKEQSPLHALAAPPVGSQPLFPFLWFRVAAFKELSLHCEPAVSGPVQSGCCVREFTNCFSKQGRRGGRVIDLFPPPLVSFLCGTTLLFLHVCHEARFMKARPGVCRLCGTLYLVFGSVSVRKAEDSHTLPSRLFYQVYVAICGEK